MPVDPAKLAKLQARSTGATKAGGARRKAKKTPKNASNSSSSSSNNPAPQEDKRVISTLRKFNCQNIPNIDEVNMFKSDGTVIHFKNPKVSAAPQCNTFTVSGHNEVKNITEIPGVLNQLGLEGLQGLQAWAKSQGLLDPKNVAKMAESPEVQMHAKQMGLDTDKIPNFEVEGDDVE